MDKNQQNPKTTSQKILDLIMEECRYWHERNDEARRGNFAILYAAAKKLVDDETLRLEVCKCEGLCEQRGLASDEVDASCRAVHGGTDTEQDKRAVGNDGTPSIVCWSCKSHVSLDDHADADGSCPHCSVEIDLEENDHG